MSRDLHHKAYAQQLMGMPISVHVRGPGARGVAVRRAADQLFDELRWAEALFSTYRPDSEISRLQRGELTLHAADDAVREVHRLCETALERTGGLFDAWAAVPGSRGLFDPTGLVKTWALTRAARPLLEVPGIRVAVGAGGDVLVRGGDEEHPWRIGIEDPRDRSRVLATVPLHDGGIATSGTAARGAHVLDPRTGEPAFGLLSATVIGPSLLWADVFATAAVALGASAVEWVDDLPGTSGLLVLSDGTVHRWSNEP